MENLVVAITNITVILPLYSMYLKGDYVTFFCVFYVGLASFISHLFENHKHCMPGIYKISSRNSYRLNRLDVLGVILVGFRFIILFYQMKNKIMQILIDNMDLIYKLLILISLNLYSESDKHNPNFKTKYIISHSLWHIGIFIYINNIYKIIV